VRKDLKYFSTINYTKEEKEIMEKRINDILEILIMMNIIVMIDYVKMD
jgi:hypothetical protein